MNYKIDFIITWVDGNDLDWQKEKNKYDGNMINSGNCRERYRDWEQLKYWFRGVEKYAPWVNKIYFVTCGQKPEWLNEKNKKLVLINHSDYMPEKYLPTFSSHPIELNFNKIKNLSEHFVYFNDDVFLINKVKPTDFFVNGIPKDDYVENVLIPYGNGDYFPFIMMNNSEFINKYFNKRKVIKEKPFMYFNFKYGFSNNLKNIFMLLFSKYSGFSVSHQSSAFLKSTLDVVWEKEFDLLDDVCKHKFRTKNDVNQYIFKYWQYCTHNFVPRKCSFGKSMTITDNNENIVKSILGKKYKTLCINDSGKLKNFELQKKIINDTFEKKFPEKSSFEK